MTPLNKSLVERIKAFGPISIADYMAECLFHPDHGYYVKRDPFGRSGDFITAPDVSQMFGELTAAWLIKAWENLGSPSPLTLCEIGPGRGIWMRDIIATITKLNPTLLSAINVTLMEKSERLAALQQETIGDLAVETSWISEFSELPDTPIFFIANELFDALPMRQYVKTDQGWLERVVTTDEHDELVFSVGVSTLSQDLLPLHAASQPEGTIFEFAPAREAFVQQLAEQIASKGGAALLIDYGHTKSDFGDTLQAVRNHAYENVFANPGEADLTSHVDFEALNIATKQMDVSNAIITTQAEFLLAMGLVERAGSLGANKLPEDRERIASEVYRLAGNDTGQMGDLFKVFFFTKNGSPNPDPFTKVA